MWQCPRCGGQFELADQPHDCGKPETIDAYIAGQPASIQPILQRVRDTIHQAVPEVGERISWRMPTFWRGRNLLHIAAYQHHLGIHPGLIDHLPPDERLDAYQKSKGAIQMPYDQIDLALIADIARWRLDAVPAESASATPARVKPARVKPSPRPQHDMPDVVSVALTQYGLWDRFNARPPYQRNDYLRWITEAKREVTRQKRLTQMLDELSAADAYMGMPYSAKTA